MSMTSQGNFRVFLKKYMHRTGVIKVLDSLLEKIFSWRVIHFCVWHGSTESTFFSAECSLGVLGCLAAQSQKSPLSQHPDPAPCRPSSLSVFLQLLMLLCLYLISQLALSAHGILCLMKTSCTQLFLVSTLVSSQTCRHNMVWEEINFFFEVQSYLPDSGLCSGFPGELSSLHTEPFPWPKANERGTSPERAMKTGRRMHSHAGFLCT